MPGLTLNKNQRSGSVVQEGNSKPDWQSWELQITPRRMWSESTFRPKVSAIGDTFQG